MIIQCCKNFKGQRKCWIPQRHAGIPVCFRQHLVLADQQQSSGLCTSRQLTYKQLHPQCHAAGLLQDAPSCSHINWGRLWREPWLRASFPTALSSVSRHLSSAFVLASKCRASWLATYPMSATHLSAHRQASAWTVQALWAWLGNWGPEALLRVLA